MGNIIEVKNVCRIFESAAGPFSALQNISMHIPENKLTILKGRSGSGKTTLLNIISALDYPTEGEVYFKGRDITKLNDRERSLIRRYEIGFVFQSVALIPIMDAFENIDFSLRMADYKENRKARVSECLHLVGLSQRGNHLPQELSGGEQQRIAIAKAIAPRPEILIADEPTGALDTASALSVIKLFRDLCEQEKISIIMTTHDTGLMEFGDCVYDLEGGILINGE